MKFKYTKEVEGPVNCFGYRVKTGDVMSLDGHLVKKAENNPDFEKVDAKTKVTATPMEDDPKSQVACLEDEVMMLKKDNAALKGEVTRLKNKIRVLQNA